MIEDLDPEIADRLEDEICSKLDLYKMNEMEDKITEGGKNDVYVSTMTIDCKLRGVTFYPGMIRKYARISNERIVGVKQIKQKKKKDKVAKANTVVRRSKSKQKSAAFLNQTTVSVRVSHKEKPVSVKIFKDGALHFTGCINAMSVIESVHVLCQELKHPVYIRTKKGIKQIDFVKDTTNLDVQNLHSFAINMVNVNFRMPMSINRPNLYNFLKEDAHTVYYDSNQHAGVNLKYKLCNKESTFKGEEIRESNDLGKNEKRVTLLIFESGHIIINISNQGLRPLKEVYSFIEKFILSNYDDIINDSELIDESINEYVSSIDIDAKYNEILTKELEREYMYDVDRIVENRNNKSSKSIKSDKSTKTIIKCNNKVNEIDFVFTNGE